MKYYSDITNQLYETREQLFKAERDYKMELLEKARADEKTKKIADLEAQIAELRGETTAKTSNIKSSDVYMGAVKESAKLATTGKPEEGDTAPTKVYDAGRDKIDYSKTILPQRQIVYASVVVRSMLRTPILMEIRYGISWQILDIIPPHMLI